MKKVLFTVMAVSLLLLPAVASATYSVWIEYNYTSNASQGNWAVPGFTSRASMLGPWDAFATNNHSQPLGNLYCIEANVYESNGGFHEHAYDPYSTATWDPPGSEATNAGVQWAAYLITRVDPNMRSTSVLTRAALQLAIWEALYDYTPTYAWSFGGGNFKINSLAPGNGLTAAQITNQATAYLNTYRGQCDWGTVLHDGQDLLKVDVPEPGPLTLVGLCLALGSVLEFRRRHRR